MVIVWSMACFCACEKSEEVLEPESILQTESFEMESELKPEPKVLKDVQEESQEESQEEIPETTDEISLEEFQAIVDAMMAEAQKERVEETSSFFDRTKAEKAFEKVNETRRANGVAALAWEESLYDLACTRAEEIVTKFSHERLDGSYVGDVMIRQMGALGCGENIASNYQSVTNLVNGWMNSDGHRENLLNTEFYAGAIACYCHNGTCYWVNLFWQ